MDLLSYQALTSAPSCSPTGRAMWLFRLPQYNCTIDHTSLTGKASSDKNTIERQHIQCFKTPSIKSLSNIPQKEIFTCFQSHHLDCSSLNLQLQTLHRAFPYRPSASQVHLCSSPLHYPKILNPPTRLHTLNHGNFILDMPHSASPSVLSSHLKSSCVFKPSISLWFSKPCPVSPSPLLRKLLIASIEP